MPTPIRVLILEDHPTDAELMVLELKRAGYDPTWERVDTEAGYLRKLSPGWDIILSDYMMPQFRAPQALELLKKSGLDIPFIIVTGSINEEVAVESLKLGAADYLLKDRLTRLGAAVKFALDQKALKQQKRQAEQALVESELRFRTTAETAADAIICIGEPDIIKFWNKKAEEMFGYAAEEVLGQKLYLHPLIVPDRYHDRSTPALKEFFTSGTGPLIGKTTEFSARRKDGTEFPIELSISAMNIKGKWQSVGIIRDVTERKKAYEEQKRLVEELTRSNADLQRFTFVASHDLHESMRNIASYVQLLAHKYKDKLDSQAEQYIHFAVEGTVHMEAMLDALLDYLRVEKNRKPMEQVSCDALLKKALDIVRPLLEDNKAQATSDKLPELKADADQLLQVFLNLLSNSLKFRSDRQLLIRISALEREHEWVFSFADNGIGIDMRFKDKVFEILQRLNGKKYPGAGVGLSICKKIIERHGGSIWLESEPGKGTTFFFTIKKER